MTLGEMTTQFTNLMNRTDLKNNTALASTFITQSIMRIERELRVPMMEKNLSVTGYDVTVGIAIPDDHLELISIAGGPGGGYQLQRANYNRVFASGQIIGNPTAFARYGNGWFLGPTPPADQTLFVQYYAKFTPLVAPSDTNVLSISAWDAVVYGALSAACDYYNDDRLPNFEKRYSQITQNLQAAADGDELTADAVVGPVYAWPDDGI